MKLHFHVCGRLALFCSVALISGGQFQQAQAGYVDEVEADQPFMWWRLDEPEGEDFAENSGEAEVFYSQKEISMLNYFSTLLLIAFGSPHKPSFPPP